MTSKYIKNENGSFVCPHCSIVKERQNTMYYHMKKKHEGKLPYECSICKKDFIQKTSLELHMLSKHKDDKVVPKMFKCADPNCKFESLTKANCRIHCLRKHFKDEIYQILEENNSCSVCKESFRSGSAFYYHAANCIKTNDSSKKAILENLK